MHSIPGVILSRKKKFSKMNVEIKKKNYTSIQDFKIALFSGLTILN